MYLRIGYLSIGLLWLGIAVYILNHGLDGASYHALTSEELAGARTAGYFMPFATLVCLFRAAKDFSWPKYLMPIFWLAWSGGAVLPMAVILSNDAGVNIFGVGFFYQIIVGSGSLVLAIIDFIQSRRIGVARGV